METDSAIVARIWGDEPFEITNAIKKFVLQDYEGLSKEDIEIAKSIPSCLPSDELYINVDKEAVRRSGMMIPGDSIPDRMYISLTGQGSVTKSFMMMLEIIAQTNFSRPIYMSTTVGQSNYGNLYKHFIQEGMAWRITPFTFEENRPMNTVCDTEKMYDNMMNKYHYGNLKQKGLYIDETTMRMCYTHRRWFANLISHLIAEGKNDKALKALKKCDTEIPAYNVPHSASCGSDILAEAYILCGQQEKGVEILKDLEKKSNEYINWYLSLNDIRFANACNDCFSELKTLYQIQMLYGDLATLDNSKKANDYEKEAQRLKTNLEKISNNFEKKCEKAECMPQF